MEPNTERQIPYRMDGNPIPPPPPQPKPPDDPQKPLEPPPGR